jgi:hypothetical protein
MKKQNGMVKRISVMKVNIKVAVQWQHFNYWFACSTVIVSFYLFSRNKASQFFTVHILFNWPKRLRGKMGRDV